MTGSLQQLYQVEDLSKKHGILEAYTPVQTALTYINQESILQEIGEKVAILHTDEYFNKFLKVFHLFIPSVPLLPPEPALRTMQAWTHSLDKPIAVYVTQQLARSVGLTIKEVAELRRKSMALPEFIDHASYQEALNAQFALRSFKKDLIKIGRKVPIASTSVVAPSHDLDEEDGEGFAREFSSLSLVPPAAKKRELLPLSDIASSSEKEPPQLQPPTHSTMEETSLSHNTPPQSPKKASLPEQPAASSGIRTTSPGEKEHIINRAPLSKKIKAY